MPLIGRTTTDRITLGLTTSWDNLDPCTMLAWVWCESMSMTAHRFLGKGQGGTGAGTSQNFYSQDFGGGDYRFVTQRSRATTSASANSAWTNFALAKAQAWLFLVGQTDTVTATNNKLMVGDLWNPPLEPSSYTTQTIGAGTVTTNVGQNAELMNQTASTFGHNGVMAFAAVYNRTLAYNEIVDEQWRSKRGIDVFAPGCRGAWRPGDDGGVWVRDRSPFKNHGTISGGTPANPRSPFVSDYDLVPPWSLWPSARLPKPILVSQAVPRAATW